MTTRSSVSAWIVGIVAASVVTALAVGPADADDAVVADSGHPGTLVAAVSVSPAVPRTGPRAVASLPRGIVVTGHEGKPVSLFADGHAPMRKSRPGNAPATFTGLKAGTAYTVVVGAKSLGRVVAIDRPARVTRLLVHATGAIGVVSLTWTYHDSKATGGSAVAFLLTATSPTATSVTSRAAGVRTATLAGLDPTALYTFSVTPTNSAGKGRSTTAGMTKSLAQLAGPATPTAPVPVAPAPSPTPTPTPAPAPPAPPASRTIYVCPAGYPEDSNGACTKTLAYTYHQEASGPAPMLDSYQTTVRACPVGYNFEDYGWIMYCRLYGPVPMMSVKDATPSGYTDNGSAWIRTVSKEAVIVPA